MNFSRLFDVPLATNHSNSMLLWVTILIRECFVGIFTTVGQCKNFPCFDGTLPSLSAYSLTISFLSFFFSFLCDLMQINWLFDCLIAWLIDDSLTDWYSRHIFHSQLVFGLVTYKEKPLWLRNKLFHERNFLGAWTSHWFPTSLQQYSWRVWRCAYRQNTLPSTQIGQSQSTESIRSNQDADIHSVPFHCWLGDRKINSGLENLAPDLQRFCLYDIRETWPNLK